MISQPDSVATGYGASIGIGEQQQNAAEQFVRDIKQQYPKARMTATGHSMGGSEAAYAGVRTDTPAVTFNAQPLPPALFRGADDFTRQQTAVVNIHSNDDPLTTKVGKVLGAATTFDLDRTNQKGGGKPSQPRIITVILIWMQCKERKGGIQRGRCGPFLWVNFGLDHNV